jgi:dTDP-4-amino-4,6-dideoxygalactose transaminase
MIPQNSPLANYLNHRSAVDEAICRVLKRGQYILGEETAAFEREFADYIGVKYATGTGNGTDALHLAMRAVGIGPGDEVITVSHTAVATVAAIEMCGALPVLVDIHPAYYTIDPELACQAITSRTKAIVPVHLYGQPVDINPLLALARQHNLYLIEDCAQAHGAEYHGRKVGSFGDMGAFSFYPTKNLGCLGDGGAVTTNRAEFYHKLVALRQYGWNADRVSGMPGFNSRLDEIQAAVLRAKLPLLDDNNKKRIQIAQSYNRLRKISFLTVPDPMPETTHVYHQYVLRCGNRTARDGLKQALSDCGIQTAIHYPTPIHLQPAYKGRLRMSEPMQITETICDGILSLPLFPELTEDEVDQVLNAVRIAFSGPR